VSQIRIVEVLAALSLTTDLASGVPFEKGLRTCVVADALAAVMGLDPADRRVVYHSALLRAVGCTGHASENAAMFADDVAFQAALKEFDPGDPVVLAAQLKEFGGWAGAAGGVMARRFVESFRTVGPQAARAGCEVSRALGPRLGLAPAAVEALDDVYERWDGLGLPTGRAGDKISLAARTVHVSEQVVLAHAHGGRGAALAEVRRRAGGHLDPDLVALVVANADTVLAPLEVPDVLAVVVSSEPGPAALVPTGQLDRLCMTLATVADLKGTHLIGHSTHVADIAEAAGRLAGLPTTDLRAAALLHDIGRVGVSSAVWDRAGPLGAAEWERVRLHTYWTDRVLHRCPALAPLAALASAHHQ
jgi:hypothetical protein